MAAHAQARPGVIARVKAHWHELALAKQGNRFQQRYARRQRERRSAVSKWLTVGAGVGVSLLGIVMLPAPGPGMIVVVIGASLIAQESRTAARALDWTEVRVRRTSDWALRMWEHAPAP